MIGFVILHYMAYDMTCKCVDNLIRRFSKNDIRIVIVDNCSPNGTGVLLKNKYENDYVKILLNSENLGFAKGNNVGYEYLKPYSPEFVVVMNNDVVIEDDLFLDKVRQVYNDYNYGVLGPDIINPLIQNRQNPSRIKPLSIDEIKTEIAFRSKMDRHFMFYYVRKSTLGRLKTLITGRSNIREKIDRDAIYENVVLHGACYIFSQEFIKQRNLAFNDRTFLYFEEDILHTECLKQKIKILYDPFIAVTHYEDVSTDLAFGRKYKKEKMKNHEMLKSLLILKEIRKKSID